MADSGNKFSNLKALLKDTYNQDKKKKEDKKK